MRKTLRKFGRVFCIAILVSALFPSGLFSSTSFTGDMVMKIKDKVTNAKIYFSGSVYRIDFNEDGQRISFIVDRKAKKTKILNMAQKVYVEIPNDAPMSLIRNPFEAHYKMLTWYKVSLQGEEKVGAFICEKKVLTMNGKKKIQTAWIAKNFDFPIKLINYKRDEIHMVMEIKNIKEEVISPETFSVPGNFKLYKEDR